MSSIRKWIASKMFSPIVSGGNSQPNGPPDGGFFGSFSRNSTPGANHITGDHQSSESHDTTAAEQSYFSCIYNHYHPFGSRPNPCPHEQHLISDLYQFYYANEDLNYISSELDTFDGRKDTERCSALVSNLKLAQDRVITLIFRVMDEIGCERATREYRLKFPDELLAGEGIESLNSQIWFGAECLAAGSTITNNQAESNYLRPIANNLTATLEQIRYDLRSCCDYLPKNPKMTKDLIRRLENFDRLFTSFEYDYVKAMLPIKSADDIESLQELAVLFSETLSHSLKKNLISKEDVEGCQPSVMIALPRLSIVRGLLHGHGSVVCKLNCDELSSILRPYHSLLLKFRDFLLNLNEEEIDFLEQLLSNNYQNNDISLTDDILYEYVGNQNDANQQGDVLSYYSKFMKCAKKYGHSGLKSTGRIKYSKTFLNKYLSSSVDLLILNHKNDDSSSPTTVRYSPLRPHKALFKSLSMPSINVNYLTNVTFKHTAGKEKKSLYPLNHESSSSRSSSSSFPSTNSIESPSSNSYPSFSLSSSSSDSSLSNEPDFMTQFKEILKRSHRSSIARNRSNNNNVRPVSSNCPAINDAEVGHNYHLNQRSFTTTGVRSQQGIDSNYANFNSSAFSNNSVHIDLESIQFDELNQVKICKKKILHQVFVMISKIADKFQTNYASELRNILRTVFLLQEIEESNELLKKQADLSYVQPIEVQLAHYSSDNADLDIVEEGIDANELMLEQTNSSFNPNASTSQAAPETSPQVEVLENLATSLLNCDICDNNITDTNVTVTHSNNLVTFRSNSLEEATVAASVKAAEVLRGQRSNTLASSSYPCIKDCSAHRTGLTGRSSSSTSKWYSQSLPSLVDRTVSSVVCPTAAVHPPTSPVPNRHRSVTSSLSSSHSSQPQSHLTTSTATTIDDRFDATYHHHHHPHLPTFFLPHPDSSNSSPYFAHSLMMPISDDAIGSELSPSLASSATTARNLLLPPTWIPDELVNTCSLCAQVFNLIRRRHHCRRCGNIFCHQCSNNFVSLKCFGYAKPVRVCNRCVVLHQQQSVQSDQQSHVPSAPTPTTNAPFSTSFGA